MLVQRQEAEEQLNGKIQKLQSDKQSVQEFVANIQNKLGALEAEKREAERSAVRLHKDKYVLKKTLDKVTSTFENLFSLVTKIYHSASNYRHVQNYHIWRHAEYQISLFGWIQFLVSFSGDSLFGNTE